VLRTRKFLKVSHLPGHVLLILLSVIAVFPIYWMFVSSLRPASQLFSTQLIPLQITFEHYLYVFQTIPIIRMLFNTIAMAILITVFQLLTSLMAAYAFARWKFLGGRLVFVLFALTWLVPFQVTMIPNYVLLAQLNWLNTLLALVIPQTASAFAILLLFQAVKAFPEDIMDAARIDGAGSWRVLWQIVVPNLRASLAALAVLLFISAWNEYFWPLLVTKGIEQAVVQIGLQMFLTQEGDQWGPLMAAASLSSLPILVIYLVLQKQVIASFMKSGLK
jgi:sn-glycerol 3-phosphate transport system permease protein